MKSKRNKLTKILTVSLAGLCAASFFGCSNGKEQGEEGEWLKDIYQNYFPIGTIIKTGMPDMYEDLYPHFNSVSAEFEMKWDALQPTEGNFAFDTADVLLEFAEENDMKMRGHALVWYKALPSWVLADGTTKEQALGRIGNHIDGVLEHYGDRVYCWDVVNEALANLPTQAQVDSGEFYRTGNEALGTNCGDWYALCGNDFIKEAFRAADAARERLGLDVKLYYNDYGLNIPVKREACLKMVNELLAEGIAIDGIGMQGHYYIGDFSMPEFENSVKAFTELGLDVQVTELDISIYPYSPSDAIYDELPESLDAIQASMYGGIFEICREYSEPWKEGAGRVTGITVWGLADDLTILDKEPVANRKNWPLLFDEDHNPKSAYYAVTDFYNQIKK